LASKKKKKKKKKKLEKLSKSLFLLFFIHFGRRHLQQCSGVSLQDLYGVSRQTSTLMLRLHPSLHHHLHCKHLYQSRYLVSFIHSILYWGRVGNRVDEDRDISYPSLITKAMPRVTVGYIRVVLSTVLLWVNRHSLRGPLFFLGGGRVGGDNVGRFMY
jgi:hypothetical protein